MLVLFITILLNINLVTPTTEARPAPNIRDQQTAYYDYQGGAKVVNIKYKPIPLMKVQHDEKLFTCPKLIVNQYKCVYHNGLIAEWSAIYEEF